MSSEHWINNTFILLLYLYLVLSVNLLIYALWNSILMQRQWKSDDNWSRHGTSFQHLLSVEHDLFCCALDANRSTCTRADGRRVEDKSKVLRSVCHSAVHLYFAVATVTTTVVSVAAAAKVKKSFSFFYLLSRFVARSLCPLIWRAVFWDHCERVNDGNFTHSIAKFRTAAMKVIWINFKHTHT